VSRRKGFLRNVLQRVARFGGGVARRPRRTGGRAFKAVVGLGVGLLSALALLVASCLTTSERAPVRPPPDLTLPRDVRDVPTVRVALVRGAAKAVVEVRGPYEVYASEEPAARPAFAGESMPATEVAPEPGPGGGLAVGSVAFRPAFARIVPKGNGTLVVDGQAYRGDLVVRLWPETRGVLVVNRVNMEEYVAGVLGCEMPLSYPDAALRAQAIAARSYGYHAVRMRAASLYDVMDDQSSQVYAGLKNENDRARSLTLATYGRILAYQGKIFSTYFHSTCGGGTIPASWVFGEVPIPPLEGAECGFCGDSKYFRWKAEVKKADLAARLAKDGFPVREVRRIDVVEKGPRGYAGVVRVTHDTPAAGGSAAAGASGALDVKGAKFRFLCGASVLRSPWFEVVDDGGATFQVTGNGFGHGVGLCQVGARGAARSGMDEAAILGRYYPKADLVKLYGDRP